ncbi:MAG: hybrid sensor histidine kinase/response regulator [Deltaproteobacteria bacterium]|nr:MAG: hybrid sensor histidine kinase/response regulator [Deltaproteobacteria bacterium]
MGIPIRTLIIEDSEDDAWLVVRLLQKEGYDPAYERVETRDAMHEALERETWDVIICDYKMPRFNGLEALKLYKDKGLDIPFIIVSGAIGEETAVAAMISGAHDYVMKNNLSRLVPAVQRELREAESRRELKQAEKEKEKLEAQNRQLRKTESLGRMAGAIVHHFNNLLQAIIGNMQLAMRIMPRDSDPVKYMTAAMQAARDAEAITNQTITYLGDTSDKLEPLDLCDLCRLLLPTLQATIPKTVILETDLPSRGPTITANANQMQQVLTNLVTNAWESVGDGQGVIHLRVKMVSAADIPTIHSPADWRPQDSVYGCLEVTDSGCGIADKDIENLFDPFFSSKFIGRGLGLAVVLGIAKAHHGAVAVQSDPGQGSTFRVFLPASAENVVV